MALTGQFLMQVPQALHFLGSTTQEMIVVSFRVLMIAFEGQHLKHVPHFMHFEWLMNATCFAATAP